MANTGTKIYQNRAKYVNGSPTGTIQQNSEFLPGGGADPNYVPSVVDEALCPSAAYFLDDKPLIVGYWGFRRMHINATYYCQVRRSSDSGVTNVLAGSGVMTGATLVEAGGDLDTWMGASTLTITRMYDQVAGIVNPSANASGNEPSLTSSGGVLRTQNGVPFAQYDGTSDILRGEGTLGINTGTGNNSAFFICNRDDLVGVSNMSVGSYGDVTNGDVGKIFRCSIDTQGYGMRVNAGNCMFENDRFPATTWTAFAVWDTSSAYADCLTRASKVPGILESTASSSTMNWEDNGFDIGGGTTSGGVLDYHFDGGIGECFVIADVFTNHIDVEDNAMAAYGISEADNEAPTAPTVTLGVVTADAATITWSGATDNVGVTNYKMYKDGVFVANDASSPYTFTGLAVDTAYNLTVKAEDDFLWLSPASNTVVANTTDTEAPTEPVLGVVTSDDDSITINWAASTDNVGVIGYRISRDGLFQTNVGSGTLTYTYNSLAGGTSYLCGVSAYDAAGNYSTEDTINKSTTTPSLNVQDVTPFPSGSSSAACGQSVTTTKYTDGGGNGTDPEIGDFIYNTNDVGDPYAGGGQWFNTNDGYAIQIQSSGLITSRSAC
jgi:hypothetical protein